MQVDQERIRIGALTTERHGSYFCPKDNYADLARRLRARRRELGWRQIDLEARLGYGEGQINRWENCREIPRGSSLLDWCNALGFDVMLKPRLS